MALANFDGRPWIAFDNQNAVLGDTGIFIARSSVAQPTSSADWDVYRVSPADLGSENLSLGVIGGRLALAFTEFVSVGNYELHYAYALTADPQQTADWANTIVGTFSDNHLSRKVDLLQWQGLPLVGQLGSFGAQVSQATTLSPIGPPSWAVFPLPNVAESGLGQGIQLVGEGGRLYVATLQGGSESPGQLVVSWTDSWPPGDLDWRAVQLFDSNDENYGGLSVIFAEGRPLLSWSSDHNPSALIAFPLIAAEDELTWNVQQWATTLPPLISSYDRGVQEATLRIIDGQLGLLHAARYNDEEFRYDLMYSRILPSPPG